MTKTKRVEWTIPFDEKGNHVSYVNTYGTNEGYTYKNRDYEFTGNLVYRGINYNHSTSNTVWMNEETGQYYIGSSDLLEKVLFSNHGSFRKNEKNSLEITGTFYFKKRGSVVLMYIK